MLVNPTPAFRADLVAIERHRMSTTQGEVTLSYDGIIIGRFGDTILRDEEGNWTGHKDSFWIGVAEKEAIRRDLIRRAITATEVFDRVSPTVDQVRAERERKSCSVVEAKRGLVVRSLEALMSREGMAPTNAELAAAVTFLLSLIPR